MKRPVLILLLFTAAVHADPAKLGTLNRDSDVMVEGLFPVFEIDVPAGATEVQIRASVNNFQNAFTLSEDGALLFTFRCTGTFNGRNFYEAEGFGDMPAYWDGSAWQFTYLSLSSPSNVEFPWLCTTFSQPTGDGDDWELAELDDDRKFVYRWCSTGQDADATWGTGVVDGAAELFFANQNGVQGATSASAQRLQRWLGNTGEHPLGTALTAQLQPAGTPGRTVIFQPSRSANLLGGHWGDWMRQSNRHLQWVVQFETVAGAELHPDGSEVWSPIRPVEWRGARLELQPAKTFP